MPDTSLKYLKQAAHFISYLFNPLLIPIWAYLLLFNQQAYFALIIPPSAKRMLLSVVAVNTTILPLLTIIMLRRLGMISSLDLDKREDRLYPLLIGAVLYYLSYFLFRKLNLPEVYTTFLLGAGLIGAAGLVISMFYKISIHMAAMGGLFGLVLMLLLTGFPPTFPWILTSVISVGLTGTARLILKAHTPAQVYLGFLMGFSLMGLSFLIFN